MESLEGDRDQDSSLLDSDGIKPGQGIHTVDSELLSVSPDRLGDPDGLRVHPRIMELGG